MKPIGTIMGHPADPRSFKHSPLIVDNHTFIGVEIELEDVGYFDRTYFQGFPFWTVITEGSLREGGREYITGADVGHTHAPICGKDVVDSLEYFDRMIEKYYKKYNKYPQLSDRTSIHVHIDIRELSYEELVSYLLLYVIFEPIFFTLFGKDRENNPYCKPISSTYECKTRLSKLLKYKNEKGILEAVASGDKYDACNLSAIRNQGSLEFRLHEGTFEGKKILKWINLLLILKNKSAQKDFSVKDLPQQASELGMLEFLKSIFGKYSDNLLINITENDILQGVRVAQDILIYNDLQDFHKNSYSLSRRGEKAGDNSILHNWARENKRSIFIKGE